MANETSIITAIVSAAAALVSGVFAAWTTVRSKRQDQLVERLKLQVTTYDTKLLEQRLKDYRDLWSLTAPTSRQRIAVLGVENSDALTERLTQWYYEGGGMLLSAEARNAFFYARASLRIENTVKFSSKAHGQIVAAFSTLRTAMCEDLNSRRGPTYISQLEETKEDATARITNQAKQEQQMQQGW